MLENADRGSLRRVFFIEGHLSYEKCRTRRDLTPPGIHEIYLWFLVIFFLSPYILYLLIHIPKYFNFCSNVLYPSRFIFKIAWTSIFCYLHIFLGKIHSVFRPCRQCWRVLDSDRLILFSVDTIAEHKMRSVGCHKT